MRRFIRLPVLLGLLLLALVASPAADAATSAPAPTPSVETVPPPTLNPGASPFTPPQQPSLAQPEPTTTIDTGQKEGDGLGRQTMLLLVGVSLLMIIGVGALIWREGREGRSAARKRRKRMRTGAVRPQTATAGRRGPPPPPRKRRQQAKKKKR